VIYEERGTADFQALQLQYGRLGAAFGLSISLQDMNGAVRNVSVECEQSLFRLHGTEYNFIANVWEACLFLWIDRGESAMGLAAQVMTGYSSNEWGPLAPPNDEAAVDAWLAAAQVCIVNTHPTTIRAVIDTFSDAMQRAKRSGDVVRTARVLGLYLLALAETMEDVPAIARQHAAEINDARRVGDGVAIGFLALAIGCWHTGLGGHALARENSDYLGIARAALEYLATANEQFEKQGMDPWLIFVAIQRAKAFGDLQDFDAMDYSFQQASPGLKRFPVFASHLQEAAGRFQLARKDPYAAESLRKAIGAAERSGLNLRAERLKKIYGAKAGMGVDG
jgi:hypothetical protein